MWPLAPPRAPLLVVWVLPRLARGQRGHGPVPGADARHSNVGWAVEHYKSTEPSVTDGVLRVQGNSRAYLVEDFRQRHWLDHKYVRLDLFNNPLSFTLDVSNVPCGCL